MDSEPIDKVPSDNFIPIAPKFIPIAPKFIPIAPKFIPIAPKFIPIEERFDKVVSDTVDALGTPSIRGLPEVCVDTEYGLITQLEKNNVDKLLKKNYPQMLKEALIRQYVKRGKHLIDHAVEVAYEDNNVLIALMKKIVPDKTGVEVNFNLSKEDREEILSRMKQMVEERKQQVQPTNLGQPATP